MTRCDLNLGFVGLGALGLPMAINLHRAGFRLRVHTRSRRAETRPELERYAFGVRAPPTPALGVDVLLLCVSDDEAVEEVSVWPKRSSITTDRRQRGAGLLHHCSRHSPNVVLSS